MIAVSNVNIFSLTDGRFGAYMQVNIENDGPVTIQLDSSKEWHRRTAS